MYEFVVTVLVSMLAVLIIVTMAVVTATIVKELWYVLTTKPERLSVFDRSD
jgi:hypothetical protein